MADLAYTAAAGKQEPASDAVLTYPCEGSTGVNYELTNETPNPVPGRDLKTNPLGVSVLIQVRSGQSLVVNSATMKEVGSNAQVELRQMVGGSNGLTDTNSIFNGSRAFIAANAPLKPGTSYTVSLAGTNNGQGFSKQFTFTTGQ